MEVYVEDIGSEVFYTVLLGRLISDKFKIRRVFALGGKDAVLQACKESQSTKKMSMPTIYIVDGDMDFVIGKESKMLNNLFVLNAYCIENYLIDEQAAVEIAFENSGKVEKDVIQAQLGITAWLAEIGPVLRDLFIVYGVAYHFNSFIPTVGRHLDGLLKNTPKGPELDVEKTATSINELRSKLYTMYGEPSVDETEHRMKSRWTLCLDTYLSIISGKDYLIPLLRWRINSTVKGKYDNHSFKLRLAKNCSLMRLANLKTALLAVSAGQVNLAKYCNLKATAATA